MIIESQIEKNPKLGYYKVGDRIFYSKPLAYIYATEVGIDPTWHFNTKTYGKIDWTQEPETDIRELYRQRAQQLRDKYDYIRLECSGGSDSTTVAYSFLLNNIHIDEIIFRYPKSGEKDATDDPYNTYAENTLSEYQYAARPLLNWIKTNFPKTTVRIHDFAKNMLEQEETRDESWVFHTRDWFQPAHGDKYNQFTVPEHLALADSGKSICVLTGIEKPRTCIINNIWYTYFLDLQANSAHPVVGDYTNITNEYFFWTPDFPEITVKQAHMIKRWFDMPQNNNVRYLVIWPNSSVSQRTAYEHIVRSIIYPDYDLCTWQTVKAGKTFYCEMDYWFYKNFKDTNLYSAWESGLKFLVDKIDKKYLKYEFDQPAALKQMFSPFYVLGPSEYKESDLSFENHNFIQKGEFIAINNKKIQKINT